LALSDEPETTLEPYVFTAVDGDGKLVAAEFVEGLDPEKIVAAIGLWTEQGCELRIKRKQNTTKSQDYSALAHGALKAIQALLDDGGIPRGTFADDQVRNLVALYNRRGDEIEHLRAGLQWILDNVDHQKAPLIVGRAKAAPRD
jgi:hypothetical protein